MATSVYFNWQTARKAGTSGNPVRRSTWSDKWITFYNGLWWVVPATPGAFSKRVVRTSDFSDADFLAVDWTNLSPSCVVASLAPIGGGSASCPVVFNPSRPTGSLPLNGASSLPPV